MNTCFYRVLKIIYTISLFGLPKLVFGQYVEVGDDYGYNALRDTDTSTIIFVGIISLFVFIYFASKNEK